MAMVLYAFDMFLMIKNKEYKLVSNGLQIDQNKNEDDN